MENPSATAATAAKQKPTATPADDGVDVSVLDVVADDVIVDDVDVVSILDAFADDVADDVADDSVIDAVAVDIADDDVDVVSVIDAVAVDVADDDVDVVPVIDAVAVNDVVADDDVVDVVSVIDAVALDVIADVADAASTATSVLSPLYLLPGRAMSGRASSLIHLLCREKEGFMYGRLKRGMPVYVLVARLIIALKEETIV